MKLKIYSIVLFLTFALIGTHEMIPHRHYDSRADYISTLFNSSSQKDEHKHEHDFPFHQHTSAANHYDLKKDNNNRDISISIEH